ncbi:MAG: RNA methyltransferase [Crocinitomicaceae bacterium]|nr:RNA methyltransferase [Crocinitomicaceae bacterium]
MESLSKNKLKFVRSLRQKKFRKEHQMFIVEGEKMVLELCAQKPDLIVEVFCSKEFDFHNSHLSVTFCTKTEMEQLSAFNTPNKLIAVVHNFDLKPTKEEFILVLDGIQDPGNMGTILRAADWFGIDAIICSEDTVDIQNEKVIQASMGSIFRVPVAYKNLETFLDSSSFPVYGAYLEGENVYQQKLTSPAILIMGNEGKGIRPNLERFITHQLTIPRFGSAESLNVGVATSILLSEFARNF